MLQVRTILNLYFKQAVTRKQPTSIQTCMMYPKPQGYTHLFSLQELQLSYPRLRGCGSLARLSGWTDHCTVGPKPWPEKDLRQGKCDSPMQWSVQVSLWSSDALWSKSCLKKIIWTCNMRHKEYTRQTAWKQHLENSWNLTMPFLSTWIEAKGQIRCRCCGNCPAVGHFCAAILATLMVEIAFGLRIPCWSLHASPRLTVANSWPEAIEGIQQALNRKTAWYVWHVC